MITLIPDSGGAAEADRFVEMNDCHSPADGKFCSGSGSRAAHQGRSISTLSPLAQAAMARQEGRLRNSANRAVPDAHGFSQGKGSAKPRSYSDLLQLANEKVGAPRVSIHPTSHRGKDGFTVRSKAGGVFGTKIFVQSRKDAEAIAHAIKHRNQFEVDRILKTPSKPDPTPDVVTHKGFTIRKYGDAYSASHPNYRAARPSGVSLGDVKTQINMFTAGIRNASARARYETDVLRRAFPNKRRKK